MENQLDQGVQKVEIKLKDQKKESFAKKLGLFVVDFLETFIIAVAIFVFVYHFLFQPHEVLGASMEPNFDEGQYILTDKISYRFRGPQRGEIIVFKHDSKPSADYIKRVIGLPGEEILIYEGKVFIFNEEYPDGVEIDESYLPANLETQGGAKFPDNVKTLVPLDSYFVLGDNREKSSDSRMWGTVPQEDIIGKAWLRYWPPSKMGLF